MIDIHCHLLFGVDDGPKKIEDSIAMLEEASNQGITNIILTPHYRRGMFKFDGDKVRQHKEMLDEHAKNLGITLHVGTEVHVNSDILEYLENGKVYTLADSDYVLTEYAYDSEYAYIFKMTKELLRYGYIPVIAHVERYGDIVKHPEYLSELREIGAMVQMNVAAILGQEGWSTKQFCKKVLKKGWVDFVASDSHDLNKRICMMDKCYAYLEKKYGEKLAHRLTIKNARKVIGE